MLIVKIRINRVLFVVYTVLAILFMGFIGSLLIPMIYYEMGKLATMITTTALLGGIVALTLGLKCDLWNR